ncbi:MAG TPA: TetR/AcrR family transcriptional regulator [Streptosporangiaceae bacterium]|jgi:AcrR family transcriptional regulator|nr:TetR/AcrR family transcriptional regulator [Streptosporangiaceae bacterium]
MVVTTAPDGRRLRRDKNRDAVIDALLDLFRDGVYQPSTAQIATQAGLSLRSLFRYFDDVEDLHRAAAARQIQLALPLVSLGTTPDEPTSVKIRAVAHARASLFEQVAPAARALRAAVLRRDVLTGELARNRAYLNRQIADLFAPELAGPAKSVLPGLLVLCSFESYELLRSGQGLSQGGTEDALAVALSALLGV